jgi:hypothetical protein
MTRQNSNLPRVVVVLQVLISPHHLAANRFPILWRFCDPKIKKQLTTKMMENNSVLKEEVYGQTRIQSFAKPDPCY